MYMYDLITQNFDTNSKEIDYNKLNYLGKRLTIKRNKLLSQYLYLKIYKFHITIIVQIKYYNIT